MKQPEDGFDPPERKAQESGDRAAEDRKQIQFSAGIPDLSLHEVLTVVIN